MELKTKNWINFSFFITSLMILLNASCSKLEATQNDANLSTTHSIHVGVIIDMGSWIGKIGRSCISMAISDFYAMKSHCKSRLVLHMRDSKGDPFQALSTAIKLMESINLQAIICTETRLLVGLGMRAKVPVISYQPAGQPLSSTEHPYFVQFAQDETSQVTGIATLIDAFGWRNVILVYENTDHAEEFTPSMISCFHDFDIRVAHKIGITADSSNEEIAEQLNAATTLQIGVFVVHMSPSLACLFFLNAKKLGMMTEGYVWIVTDKTMNFLRSMSSSVVTEAMQGVLGFKPYIPPSKGVEDFTSRWKRKFFVENPDMEEIVLNSYGLWAYDALWTLAMAAERARIRISESKNQGTELKTIMGLATIKASRSGSIILKEMLQSEFKGLSGEIGINRGKLISRGYEIINVLGNGERRVGFWTPDTGITKEIMDLGKIKRYSSKPTPSPSNLETIIWPGGLGTISKRRFLQTKAVKLKIGVPRCQFQEFVNISSDPETNATNVTGFSIDVFKAAIRALDYQVEYEIIPFLNAGGQAAGSYEDLIHQVYLQKYDAVVGDITIEANRSLYVDFTLPYTDLGYATLVRTNTQNDNMWIFLKPLTTGLWLTSAAFFIMIGLVVWVIEHPANPEFQGSASQQIGNALWFGFSTLAFAHSDRLSSNLSKLVVIVWVFAVLILTSSYTATLASMLTVQQIQSVSTGTRIYVGFQAHSGIQGVLISNLNFKDSNLKPYKSPEEYAEALSKGSNNGGVSAIIDEIPYLQSFLAKCPNQYTMINPTPETNGFGFAFRKGSPLVADISRQIAKLREEGNLKEMEDSWFKGNQRKLMTNGSSNNGPNALSLNSFGGLFLTSAATSSFGRFHILGQFLYTNAAGIGLGIQLQTDASSNNKALEYYCMHHSASLFLDPITLNKEHICFFINHYSKINE